MSNNKPYTPVSCDMHSEFELLIMHNTQIKLCWQDQKGNKHNSNAWPKDLQTKSGEEFLLITDENNTQQKVRLDRIQSFEKI